MCPIMVFASEKQKHVYKMIYMNSIQVLFMVSQLDGTQVLINKRPD